MHGGGKSPYVHTEAESFSLILTLGYTMSRKKQRDLSTVETCLATPVSYIEGAMLTMKFV